MSSPYQKTYFLLSAADVKQLPPDEGMEVAMVGRSNAGKSSVLNRITQSKGLARVSKTPGRTQMINMFVIDDKRRIADLPGYGFARAPEAAKKKWEKTVDTYICARKCLRGMILVMDIRHPFKELDLQLLEYCEHNAIPVHILLNKADKFSKGAVAALLPKLKKQLKPYSTHITMQVFSALKGQGIDELFALLKQWFDNE